MVPVHSWVYSIQMRLEKLPLLRNELIGAGQNRQWTVNFCKGVEEVFWKLWGHTDEINIDFHQLWGKTNALVEWFHSIGEQRSMLPNGFSTTMIKRRGCREWSSLTADDSNIFMVTTVFISPDVTWTLFRTSLVTTALDFIHPDGTRAHAKVTVLHNLTRRVAQTSAYYVSIWLTPAVITYCTPLARMKHFNTALVGTAASRETHYTRCTLMDLDTIKITFDMSWSFLSRTDNERPTVHRW